MFPPSPLDAFGFISAPKSDKNPGIALRQQVPETFLDRLIFCSS